LRIYPDGRILAIEDYSESELWELADGTITARVGAASLAAGFAGTFGGAISGAGAVATNVILTKTNAYVESSNIVQALDVKLEAENKSRVVATVAALSVAIGAGGTVGAGVSIGASIARNYIGYDQDGREQGAEVQAYILNSSIAANGDLELRARADERIDAVVLAGSGAVAAGGTAGLAASGAGVSAVNRIANHVRAFVDGDGSSGINARTVSLTANDSSGINALGGAVSIAVSFAGGGAASLSVGVALAENSINNLVQVSISNAYNLEATVGDVTLIATESNSIKAETVAASAAVAIAPASISISGGAASALNTITSTTTAFIDRSPHIQAEGGVRVEAKDTATIQAEIEAISAAGGIISVAVGLGLSTNTAANTVRAYIRDSSVTAINGKIEVISSSAPVIFTETEATALSIGFGVGAAGADSKTKIEVITESFLQSADLEATGNSVTVQATSTSYAAPVTKGNSGGLVAVSLLNADAVIRGSTRAYVGGTGGVAADTLEVRALDANTARPKTRVVAAGAITVNKATSDITLTRMTEAQIASGADLTISSGDLVVSAESISASIGAMTSTGVGAITLGFLTVTSSIDSTTRAAIAAGARVSVPNGNVDVVAATVNLADARTSSTSIGAVTFDTSDPTARITATTEALALGDISGPDGTPGAVTVRVSADGNDATTAGAESLSIGLVSIGSSTVVAETAPTVTTRVGGTIRASGDVVLSSTSVGDADAASKTTSGGAVAVTDLDASAKSVTNVTTEILPNTIIQAGGDITISAGHGEVPAPSADGTFNAATDVDINTETIDLGLKHGLLTGDTVTYDKKGGTVIGGLGHGRTYGVIVEDSDSKLKLGTTFQTGAVDITTDVLTFSAPHNLATGDRVIYQPAGGSGVGGLTNGGTYQVVVIDSYTIKLRDPAITLADAQEFSGSAIAGDTITLVDHGFSEGQAVTYREPAAVEFGLLSVDVVGGPYNAGDPGSNMVEADNDNIFLGPNHGLVAGDEVIYTAARGNPIPELTSGQRYFVIFDPVKPHEIQLARTLAEALGDPGDPDATPAIPETPPTPIALSRSTDPAAESTPLSLRKVTDQAIGGLTDGVTYYVTQVVGHTFQLATDAAGTSIVSLGAVDSESGVTLTGTSTLGTEGVDLTNAGSDTHHLVIDLTDTGGETQLLEGVGGARALAGAPSGDGIVTASASGSGGGIVRSSNALTRAINIPTVRTVIGNGTLLTAVWDINVGAESHGNASASSANRGGGLVSIGDAESHLTISNTGRVDIGSSALRAGRDITVTSNTTVNGSVLASSDGGGLVDFADADVTANITYASVVYIAADADLRAENILTLDATSVTVTAARAVGDSAGLGSSADTEAFLAIGTPNRRAVTETFLGERARLQGGNEVVVRSRVVGLVAVASAEAESGGAIADAEATARIDVYDAVKVDLATDSAVTAEKVTIASEHTGVYLWSRSDADTDGFYADAESEARAHYDSMNDVVTSRGATIAAGVLAVTSNQKVAQFFRSAAADVDVFGDESTSTPGQFLPRRSIDWNGDVTFLADPTPELEIDANGVIVKAEGVTVNGLSEGTVSGDLNVDPIVNNNVGAATFTVNDDVIGSGPAFPDGEIKGSSGTISSGSTFSRVDITNRSDNPLVIHDIMLANGTVVPDITLTAKVVKLNFEVGNLAPAGDFDIFIFNEGSGEIRINGLVENPLGLIRIENGQGAIVSNGGTDDIIRGQRIELISAAGIGSAGLRLNADLVTSERRSTDFDAQAADDIWLNLTGRVRDTDSGNSHFNAGRVETSAGDVDILFQTSLQEIQSTGSAAGVSVKVIADTAAIDPAQVFLEHFRPDTAAGPAPLDFRVFADTSQAVEVDGSYSFEQITGTNINLNASNSDPGDPLVSVVANTNHGDSGQIDALFNGDITLTETAGDFLLNSIQSTAGSIDLTVLTGGANAVFVQAAGNIDLDARGGGVNAELIRAIGGNIRVDAAGDIEVDLIEALDGDVTLTAGGGDDAMIYDLDVADDTTTCVRGNSISLNAPGNIGTVTNFLEIDSSFAADGLVDARAERYGIFLLEIEGDLRLGSVASGGAGFTAIVDDGDLAFATPSGDWLTTPSAASFIAAEQAIAAVRSNSDIALSVFDLFYDGMAVTVTVPAGNFVTPELLRAHVQAAVDQAMSDAGERAGDVVVSLGPEDTLVFGLGHTLEGESAAEEAVAGARIRTTLTADVTFTLVYDGVDVAVTVPSGDFTSPEDLRSHVQTAVDEAMEGAGNQAGDVVVSLGIGDVLVLSLVNSEEHTLEGNYDAEAALVAARVDKNSVSEVTFALVYDGQIVNVTVTAGDFATHEELRGHVEAAVNLALVNASLGIAGDISVRRDANNAIRFSLGHTLGDTSGIESDLAAARRGNNLDADVTFDIVHGRTVTVSVSAGNFATPEELRANIQFAVDRALVDAGLGLCGDVVVDLDPEGLIRLGVAVNPFNSDILINQSSAIGSAGDIAVTLDTAADDALVIGLGQVLGGAGAANAALADARTGTSLADVSFELVFDDRSVTVDVDEGIFPTVEDLRVHVQSALSRAIVAAGGGITDVVVRLGAENALVIELGHDLSGASAAQTAIAAARIGNDLIETTNFSLVYDGSTVPVTVEAGTFPSAEALRAHVQAAVDLALMSTHIGPDTATWTFTGLPDGVYRVSATWDAVAILTHKALYTVYQGGVTGPELGSVAIDQTVSPDDFTAIGTVWQELGGPYTVAGGTLTVQLSDLGAGGFLGADAVRIEQIFSSDVCLIATNGSILDGAGDPEADVQARSIDLIANQGSIGEADNDVEIYGAGIGQRQNPLRITTAVPEQGRLYATADGDIYIEEINAALRVLAVDSGNGDVGLKVLDTALLNENFRGPFGEDLIVLDTPGQTLLGTAIASGRVTAPGTVTIDAGDDVHIPLGALVQGGVSVVIMGDIGGAPLSEGGRNDERDANTGTTIDIRGDVLAPTVTISGGADMDFIQITGTGGINPTGNTFLKGNGADDRFFIQSVSGPTFIDGGQGADRYYVSSDASVAGFSTRGYFDLEEADPAPPDPFDLLTGTLDNIKATLTIDTGEGGGGGTRDVIRVSAGGSTTPVHGVIDRDANTGIGRITGMGIPASGRVEFSAPAGDSAFVMVGLTAFDDTFRVKGVESNIVAYVQGRGGDDTLEVGNDSDRLVDISGIVAFFGESGTDDTLNIHGDGTAGPDATTGLDPDQLTAIGLTGLQMGDNHLYSTHEWFGAGYDSDLSSYPGAVYYARRQTLDAVDTISSTVEHVNVLLSADEDTLTVDSVYDAGTTIVRAGDGADIITVGSTGTGLYPYSTRRVDFINGVLQLFGGEGTNTIVVDDSGDENPNVGTYEGNSVYGLDMAGLIDFYSASDLYIKLGAQADTFYVPGTNENAFLTLQTGGGFDTVYVGTVEGNESGGSLNGIAGDFLIDGQGPEAQDTLYLNDQDDNQTNDNGRTYEIDNAWTAADTKILSDGREWPIDTTTVSRSDMASIRYRSMETVVLSTGPRNDTVNVYATHREQSTEGGKNSSFTINAGDGADTVNLGRHTGGGLYSLEPFSIDLASPPDPAAIKGIPVIVNGQGGEDTVHFLDDAATAVTELAFTERDFNELFPRAPTVAATAVLNLSNGDIVITATSALPEFNNVTIRFVADDTVEAGYETAAYDADAKTLTIRVNSTATSTLGNIEHAVDGLSEFTATATDGDAVFDPLVNLGTTATTTDSPGSFRDLYTEIFGEDPESTSYATVVLERAGEREPLNVNARKTEIIEVSLGSGADIVQITSGSYDYDIRVNAGGGADTLNVENGVDMLGNEVVFNGEEGDDVAFVDFSIVSIVDRGELADTITGVSSSSGGERVAVPSGSSALEPGTYFIETRLIGEDRWQFRLVDAAGSPVSIAAAGETDAILLSPPILGTTLIAAGDAAIAAARSGNDLGPEPVEFDLLYDGRTVAVTVDPGTFSTPELLRAHVQAAVDSALVAAGAHAGNLVVRLDEADAIVFGLPNLDPDSLSASEGAIAAARSDNDLLSDLTFELVCNGETVSVTVAAGSFTSAEELLAHVEAAVSAALPGIVDVSLGTRLTGDWQGIDKVPEEDTDGSAERAFDTLRGFIVFLGNDPAAYREGSVATGTAAELLAGVPSGKVSLEFNGGTNDLQGDTFRIAGDGAATGGEYHPSTSEDQAGSLNVGGNTFTFSGVEPLVVHGLPDFQVITPADQAAHLTLDSVSVNELELSNLALKIVTVDGVVSWTQQDKFEIVDALEPLHVAKATAASGDILAVAADLDGATYGTVYIYEWNDGWNETAKLYPGDRSLGSSDTLGQEFGASIAISGTTLVVGAPGDDARRTDTGAVYVFERIEGSWQQVTKLKPLSSIAGEAFGSSVAIDQNTIVVGAPGTATSTEGAVYVFSRSGGGWVQSQRFSYSGTDIVRAVAVAGDYFAWAPPTRMRLKSSAQFWPWPQGRSSWVPPDGTESTTAQRTRGACLSSSSWAVHGSEPHG